MKRTAVEFRNVTKSYGDKVVIDNLNLSIPQGHIVVLVGPSGCGKTTTMKMINRLIEPTSGEVFVFNQDVRKPDRAELRRRIGYVIQQIGLFPHMTIAENISLVPRLTNGKKGHDLTKIDQLLELVGLDAASYRDRYPAELSGGQQQRVGVARALMANPPIILMDEPFSALDPITREQLQDELIRLNEELHKTIVFVTHDMDEALKIADTIIIMGGGRVIQQGSPDHILRHPANEFVRGFLGEKRLSSHRSHTVADVMLPNPVKMSRYKGLAEAVQTMQRKRVTSILVADQDGRYRGIADTSDIYKRFHEESMTLGDVMRTNVPTLLPEMPLSEAISQVQNAPFGHVPVVNAEGKLVGLMTRASLVDLLAKPYLEEAMASGE
ncbi:ABC transporter ATP-binding protein [Tumebacillus flagellatus]|uniref:Quaternary amine transport ATP-binding protein n=1 Tax=Tumebacillus flagellatus TaxID=1157490 RepID=A0A074LPV8_9BACL|nr:betaine/proline/choline family ABC transporter ATP-binding protein [Tumebacillus flagellatus]KEO84151.1 glycine/betaine ABC transporter ATP-binding protein [Tumebacillus flagellatus]